MHNSNYTLTPLMDPYILLIRILTTKVSMHNPKYV